MYVYICIYHWRRSRVCDQLKTSATMLGHGLAIRGGVFGPSKPGLNAVVGFQSLGLTPMNMCLD